MINLKHLYLHNYRIILRIYHNYIVFIKHYINSFMHTYIHHILTYAYIHTWLCVSSKYIGCNVCVEKFQAIFSLVAVLGTS